MSDYRASDYAHMCMSSRGNFSPASRSRPPALLPHECAQFYCIELDPQTKIEIETTAPDFAGQDLFSLRKTNSLDKKPTAGVG
jgi:hypothetical protein